MARPNKHTPKGAVSAALDAMGIDEFCARLESGQSNREIAAEMGISEHAVRMWIGADETRSARAKISRHESAAGWMDRGLMAIASLPPEATPAQVAQMREMAQHCRRMAAIRDPRGYGERVQADVEHSGGLTVEIVKFGADTK